MQKNFFKKPLAFLLAMVMTLTIDLPMGASGIWNLFDFVKTARADTRPSKTVTTVQPSGSGTSKDPYLINSVETLYWFADSVNSGNNKIYGTLTCDISVNTEATDSDCGLAVHTATTEGVYLKPIGTSSRYYKGVFDGNGYTIRGLYEPDSSKTYIGLFAYNEGTIKNLTISAGYINGSEYVGGICARNTGTIENCKVQNSYIGAIKYCGCICGNFSKGNINNCIVNNINYIYSSDNNYYYIGGICGDNYNGTIQSCTNNSSFIFDNTQCSRIGGISGYNEYGTINSCINTNTIKSTHKSSDCIGGISGYNIVGKIQNCTNSGTIYGAARAGGICGGNSFTITDCINKGNVKFTDYEGRNIGGICGENFNTTSTAKITGCYNTGTIQGGDCVGGVVGLVVYGTFLTNCYNTGTVKLFSATSSNYRRYVGGIAGRSQGSVENCYNNSNVTNTGSGPYILGGVVGYNEKLTSFKGTVTNCYNNKTKYSGDGIGYDEVSGNTVTNATAAVFATGEIAYKLQNSQTDAVWGQKIGTDSFPVFSNDVVYYNSIAGYHNHGDEECTTCYVVDLVDGVYQIANKKDLLWFTTKVNGNGAVAVNGKLIADIDMEGDTVTPIGCGSANAFTGTFDGDNHTISNYVVTTDGTYDDGLFGYVDGGKIKNVIAYSTLKLNFNNSTNSNSGHAHSGFVAHLCNSGVVENCQVHTDINILSAGNYNRVGVVVANAEGSSTVNNCKAYGSMTSSADEYLLANAGGIVGRISTATVTNCENNASFTLSNKINNSTNASITCFGGIIGDCVDTNTISNCKNNGSFNITATDTDVKNVGGIIGFAEGNSATPNVDSCVNTGALNINSSKSGSSATNSISGIGGILGGNNNISVITINKCTNNGEINISGNTASIPEDCIVVAHYIGGIVGNAYKATTVSKCLNTGNITITDVQPDQHAGIVGYSGHSVALRIESCGNVGNITSQAKLITPADNWGSIGGILSYINNNSTSKFNGIDNCYNSGKLISYLNNKGGIIGQFNGSLTEAPEDCTNYYLAQEGVNGINGTTINNMTNNTVTEEDVTGGKLCYTLNKGVTDGTQIWYQTIGDDLYPVFSGNTVYYSLNRETNSYEYSNSKCIKHKFVNGICEYCGDYEEITTNTNGEYMIYNAGQYNALANMINSGTNSVNAVLMDNIDFTAIEFIAIGTEDYPYIGVFNGNNYTITVKQNKTDNIAPFNIVGNCTIKNLITKGTITTGQKFAAGIVSGSVNNSTANIEGCISAIDILSSVEGDGTHGGIVGVANGNINMNNCAFIGSIQGVNTNSCGGLIGWANGTINITNSYVAADLTNIGTTNGNTFVRCGKATVSLNNCYYINEYNATPDNAIKVTDEQLKSGEICYSLNNGVINGTQGWYQTVVKDTYPVLKGNTVLYDENEKVYYNKGTGDVDLSGEVDSKDVAYVLKYVSGNNLLKDYQLVVADMDNNNVVNMLDVIAIIGE